MRLEGAWLLAGVGHVDEDHIVARRTGDHRQVQARERSGVQLTGEQRVVVGCGAGREDPKTVEDGVLVGGAVGGLDGDLDFAVAIGVLRVEPKRRRLVLADIGDGVHRLRLCALDAQGQYPFARLVPPALAQRERNAARWRADLELERTEHMNGNVLEARRDGAHRLHPTAVYPAAIEPS